MDDLKKYIRSIPNFRDQGFVFYDLTTLFENPTGFDMALSEMEKFIQNTGTDKIIGIEARGFIMASAIADRLKLPLIIARKKGKLPSETVSKEYQLEYGTDILELHTDAISKGERAIIVDDLIATGGTIKAVCELVEQLGGEVNGISAVVGLEFLPYKKILSGYNLHHLITYSSE